MEKLIAGIRLDVWKRRLPLLEKVAGAEEVFWTNPLVTPLNGRQISAELGLADIEDAENRLKRFAPYLAKVFPETRSQGGIIESPLIPIPTMQKALEAQGQTLRGSLYLKCDSHLPISGSVKARGGIYEVLKTAEAIALEKGVLKEDDDYAMLDDDSFKGLFSQYQIMVGSTGNLGLSIGIMSARLGFEVTVHMSAEAKQWKKDLLREKGARVIEYEGDYETAVAAGRKEAEKDPRCHFVDDEQSRTLFLGYAVAAKRLKRQLDQLGLVIDEDHPLFVYLPCGVGGAPGGITFGLRTIFGNAAHCFFAEPTHSAAMLLGLMTGKHNEVSVQDFGLDNNTAADGLAVGRPSGFVGKTLERDISGVFTVKDQELYRLLCLLADTEHIFLEPSSLAGFPGPGRLFSSPAGQEYLRRQGLEEKMERALHLIWSTGGGMAPTGIMDDFYRQGKLHT
jgi:D-serine dehydratase